MYKIVLASRNKNKIGELREMLAAVSGKIDFLSLDDIGFEGDIEEDGESYEENSVIKSSVPASYGYIGIADDSGLSVDVLDGAPGVYSARYAGEHVTYTDNNEKLLKVLENEDNRAAKFVCVMSITVPTDSELKLPAQLVDEELSAYASKRCGRDVKVITVRGECHGTILRAGRGSDGFGYDPLFYFEEAGKTFAEMTHEEKNAVSHRGAAVSKFIDVLKLIFKEEKKVLTSKQRASLRSMANGIDTIFQIGKGGVTDEICRQIDAALEARELIKARVLQNSDYTAKDAANEIASAIGADVVSVIGSKFVLYKESKENKQIELN